MSGRSSRSNARGGRGRNDRQGRGGGRGHSYTGASMAHMSGLCDTLGGNVFDYGHKEAADQGRISWETLVQYVGATYGQDISNELQNKIAVILRTCAHSIRHSKKHRLRANGTRRSSKLATGTKGVAIGPPGSGRSRDRPGRTHEAQQNLEVPIELTDSKMTQFNNEWRTYRKQSAQLTKHRGQAFSLILGQCTQLLQDRMKQDTDFIRVSTSYDPLLLYRLNEKRSWRKPSTRSPLSTTKWHPFILSDRKNCPTLSGASVSIPGWMLERQ
jgi:hypothetical protein